MAELVDASDLKSDDRKIVGVRVPPCPHFLNKLPPHKAALFLGGYMLEDFIRTLKKTFSWVTTVLPQGIKLALKILAVAAVCFIIGIFVLSFIFMPLFSLCISLAFFVLFFFRNPERNAQFNDWEITSPADGTVLSIKTEGNPDVVVVRIFLSIFDVHVQRAPVAGEVIETRYTKGSFLFANNPNADRNERNLILFNTNKGQVAIEQITGAIARRIECWTEKGQQVAIGQRVSFIRFGSQVTLYLPKDRVILTVKEGQAVQGGLTVMGLWR